MNEQQVKDLLAAMSHQTAAMNRLAESNEALVAVIYQSMVVQEIDAELPQHTYLSEKPRG